MAVPKKRTGHSAQGKRRSNWKAVKPETAKCPNCGATVLAHTVCMSCGQYKGKVVSIKAPDYVEADAAVKPAKKSTKSKKSEAKAEEVKTEQPVEEAKAEAAEEVKAEEAAVEAVENVKAEAEEKTEE